MGENVRHSCREPRNNSAIATLVQKMFWLSYKNNYGRKNGNGIAEIKDYLFLFYKNLYYVLLHIKSSRYRKYTREMLKKLNNRGLLFKLTEKCFTVTSSSLKYVLPAEPQGKSKNTGVGILSLLQQIFLIQE